MRFLRNDVPHAVSRSNREKTEPRTRTDRHSTSIWGRGPASRGPARRGPTRPSILFWRKQCVLDRALVMKNSLRHILKVLAAAQAAFLCRALFLALCVSGAASPAQRCFFHSPCLKTRVGVLGRGGHPEDTGISPQDRGRCPGGTPYVPGHTRRGAAPARTPLRPSLRRLVSLFYLEHRPLVPCDGQHGSLNYRVRGHLSRRLVNELQPGQLRSRGFRTDGGVHSRNTSRRWVNPGWTCDRFRDRAATWW